MIAWLLYAVFSALLVGLYRYIALRYHWLDLPNQRSSHTFTTPRGAGLIFALLIVGAGSFVLHSHRALLTPFVIGLIVALIGWYDDIRGARASVRFVLYAVSATAAVVFIFASRTIVPPGALSVPLSWLYAGAGVFGLLWLINLYNFMDGINGIAGIEALFVLIVAGLFARGTPYGELFAEVHAFGIAAIAGFLWWNFPVGKVFMGDAGSAFLGFFIGVLMLWCVLLHGPSMAVWLILLAVFIVDSSYTLSVRIGTGQIWYAPHRLHAYQRLTDLLGSHARTVGVLMIINIAWLLPVAWLVHKQMLTALPGVGLAYLPLFAACLWLKAGVSVKGRV